MNASRAALMAVAGLGAMAALAVPRQAPGRTALEPLVQPIQGPVNRNAGATDSAPTFRAHLVDRSPARLAPDPTTRPVTAEREALADLTRLLEEPVFDRERWERAANALAAGLDRRAARRLLALSSELGIDEVLAAAALLTHTPRDGARAPLPPTALAALRTAWSGAVGPRRSSAAVRSLLALGDVSDRRGVLAELHAPDADRRGRASWGLQGSGGADRVKELADEFGALRVEHDETAALQALTALRSVVSHTTDWNTDLRQSVELQLRDVLEREPTHSVLHLRAAAVLASLPERTAQASLSTSLSGAK